MTTAKQLTVRILGVIVIVGAVIFGGHHYLSDSRMAPNVTYAMLNGQTETTDSLKGNMTIVHFWATSCETCMNEMPRIVNLYKQFEPKGLKFVGVAMGYDQPNYIQEYVKTRQLPFPVSYDATQKIAQAFGNVQLTPTTFVIDQTGHIVKKYVGEPDFAQLEQLLDKSLVS